MRFYPLRVVCLLVIVYFLSLSWIKSFPDDGELQVLDKRLSVAEELGGKVSKDLSLLLKQLGNMTRAANVSHLWSNTSSSSSTTMATVKHLMDDLSRQSLPQASIHFYMPHLRKHPNSLVPHVVLGKGRSGVTMVLGIPTVKREKQSYLVSTLSSLLSGLTSSEMQDLLIIVFVAETDLQYVEGVARSLSENFPKEVQSGLLEVVSPSQYYYPDFNTLKETFGDSKDRVKWRTKQNLDYSFLMLYAQDKGTYYVQLEDDIFAKSGYYSDMKAFTMLSSNEWLYLEFSQLGFIGKMFKTRDLPMIAEFFLMFHKDKPIDWLLDHILWVKVCNPEKDNKHCDLQKGMMRRRFKPSLFQHVGLHSSLPGKLQHLKDKDFGKEGLFQAHNNPAAAVNSSMKHYQQHSLERLYKGSDFMWALTPVRGDYILFSFPQPIRIAGYLFRSGNSQAVGDKFHNTTVEVLSSNTRAAEKLLAGSPSKYKRSDSKFVVIGEFYNGVAEGEIPEVLQPISALRLVVHSDSDVWALLSEIHIKV